MPKPALNAVVVLRTEISPWLIILRVVPDQWRPPDFEPGQFAVLGLPGAAEPCALAEFALGIADRIWLLPRVTGLFTLDLVPEDQNVVMIATGTGLAPYMSMLTTHLICAARASSSCCTAPGIRGIWVIVPS